jgi:hypothetical protein
MMSRFPTWGLTALLTAVTVTVVLAAEPSGEPTGTDGQPLMSEAECAECRRHLDARQQVVAARIAYKEVLITELVEGRAALADVATEFLRLNREFLPALESIRLQCPGATDEEKHAHNVIGFARMRRMPDDRKAELLARLDREFQAIYGHPALVQ